MKKLYFLVMLSVVFNNVVQAQDTIPEQRVTDPLKVQRNEPVFTDKQLLYINEMALERSEASADRALDLFSKTIDTITLYFTLFSIVIAIIAFVGFNEIRQIRQFRKSIEDSLGQIRQEGIDEFTKLKNEIIERSNELSIDLDNSDSRLKSAIKEVSLLNYIELRIKEGKWKFAFDDIQKLKRELRDEKNLLLLKKQEAIVRSFDKNASFYNLDLAKALMSEYLNVNPTDARALDLLGFFEYELWKLKKDKVHLENGINYFRKIIKLDNSDTEPIEKKRAYANIAEGFKRKNDYKTALNWLSKAEEIEEYSNKSLEEFIDQTKQHCLKMKGTEDEA